MCTVPFKKKTEKPFSLVLSVRRRRDMATIPPNNFIFFPVKKKQKKASLRAMLLLLKATPLLTSPKTSRHGAGGGGAAGLNDKAHQGMKKQVVRALYPPTHSPVHHHHPLFSFLPSRCHKINVISRVFIFFLFFYESSQMPNT